MKRILGILILTLAVLAPASAQVLYGSLTGTVQDSGGAVVPGATVTVHNTGTAQEFTAQTNEVGSYTFSTLLAGVYDLTITANGFRPVSKRGLPISVNTVRREDVALEIGQVTETVNVQAGQVALQTDKTDLHTDLSSKDIINLPLPRYRNYQSLINLVPGATPGRLQNSIQAAPGRALETNVNGVNRNNNATRIDGALSVFLWLPNHSAYVPPAETIETVNVATNSFDAEQGMAGGAAVTVITKSGTNTIHGSAWALNDNARLQAKNFFNTAAKPKNNNNIDGVTIGGPVVKNKFFYFFGWEGEHERLGATTLLSVPTADLRAGNFSRAPGAVIYDPASSAALNGSGRTPYPDNTVPLSRQSSIVRRIQDLIPLPTDPSRLTSNFLANGSQKLDKNHFDMKVNWNHSASLSAWGKYSIANFKVSCDPAFGQGGGSPLCPAGSSIGDGDLRTQVATVGATKIFSPTFLYDGIFGWTRQGQAVTGFGYGTDLGSKTYGIPGTNGRDIRESGAPSLVIQGFTNHLSDTDTRPFFMHDMSFTTSHNFGLTRPKHDIRFGFEAVRHVLNHYSPDGGGNGGPQGALLFNPGITSTPGASLTIYNSYASYLLGLPEIMRRASQFEIMTAYNNQAAWYVRDRFQATQNLTISLGLRYELYPLQTRSGRGGIEGYDPNTNLVSLGGVNGIPKDVGISTGHKMFAPRVGFSYRLGNKTVIRSGYGLAYNPMPMARPLRGFFPLIFASNFNSANSFQPVRTIEQGIPQLILPDLSSGRAALPATAQIRFIPTSTLTRGYVQSWNFMIEHQLPGQTVASIGYVGTKTVHSFGDLEINAAAPGAGTAGRPLNVKFGHSVDTWAWDGYLNANYHAVQASITRRAADGLTLKGAYTYAKAINQTDDDGWTGTISWNWAPVFNRNRAQAGYNIPQIFQMGFVYELPTGKGKKFANTGVSKAVLGGWQVNGVFASFQGRPFTVSAAAGALNAPGNAQTADQVKPVVEKIGNVGAGLQFFDPTAFAAPTGVRFGSTGRNILRGPGSVNLDLGVFRKFPIKERATLEFRAEAANSMNTPHFNNPNANINGANFLQVTSAQPDQRQFRLGLRMAW